MWAVYGDLSLSYFNEMSYMCIYIYTNIELNIYIYVDIVCIYI